MGPGAGQEQGVAGTQVDAQQALQVVTQPCAGLWWGRGKKREGPTGKAVG
jgi:hypothetical protein